MDSVLTYILAAVGASILLSNFTVFAYENAKSKPDHKTRISFWLCTVIHFIVSSPLLLLLGIAIALGWLFNKLPHRLQDTLSITFASALGVCLLLVIGIPLLILLIIMHWG